MLTPILGTMIRMFCHITCYVKTQIVPEFLIEGSLELHKNLVRKRLSDNISEFSNVLTRIAPSIPPHSSL